MKKKLFAVVVLAIGALFAHLYAQTQRYHPVVKIAVPGGIIYTAVFEDTAERQACGEAGKRFIEAVRSGCTDCQVVSARCKRELAGLELALSRRDPIAHS